MAQYPNRRDILSLILIEGKIRRTPVRPEISREWGKIIFMNVGGLKSRSYVYKCIYRKTIVKKSLRE
jgi:hypothetical protein